MKISQLYVYPIKSLRGQVLSSGPITYQGFKYDRRFMLLRASDQKNMHVSEFTEMCLFTTQLIYPTSDSLSPGKIIVTYTPPILSAASENEMPRMGSERQTLEVPLEPSFAELETIDVMMHSSPTKAYNMGENYNSWFSSCFGYGVILAYIGDKRREILGAMPPKAAAARASSTEAKSASWLSSITASVPFLKSAYAGVDEGISFSDCAPYLVVSEKSWKNASARLPDGETMDISKFRPNIVVSGAAEDFEEDYWAELAVGQGKLKVVLTQNCARCNSLNIDYATGKVGEGAAGTILKRLQRDRRVDPGSKYSPIFGRYGFFDSMPEGSILSVGDEVIVVKRNAERTRWEWPNLTTS